MSDPAYVTLAYRTPWSQDEWERALSVLPLGVSVDYLVDVCLADGGAPYSHALVLRHLHERNLLAEIAEPRGLIPRRLGPYGLLILALALLVLYRSVRRRIRIHPSS